MPTQLQHDMWVMQYSIGTKPWSTLLLFFVAGATATSIILAADKFIDGGSDGVSFRSAPGASVLPVPQQGHYQSAPVERYILDRSVEMRGPPEFRPRAAGCNVMTEESSPIYGYVQTYLHELDEYNRRVEAHGGSPIPDVRRALHGRSGSNGGAETCRALELDPEGLPGIFRSGQLSKSARQGYTEPLLPPARHPRCCFDFLKHQIDMSHLVHDFPAYCRSLTSTSRTILVDMGASLQFHDKYQPMVKLIDTYRKFGIIFDHIYAFEVTPTPTDKVFSNLPEHMAAAYHWINIGVSADKDEGILNPLRMVLNNFDANDFVVVKLDVDTPSIELPLISQLMDMDAYADLIDVFYFEHHFAEGDGGGLPGNGSTLGDRMHDSLDMFYHLRQKGIQAHYWI